MATLFVDFVNNTDRLWTMVVYQTLPNSPGLTSVAWLRAKAPEGAEAGVQFDLDFNVALANFQQHGSVGVYTAYQVLSAGLGTAWEIVFQDGVQQLMPAGSAPLPQQIWIVNNSGTFATPGIGMSGIGSVYKKDLFSGAGAQFQATPTFYVGLFNDVMQGQTISGNIVVGPEKLLYPAGATHATVTATVDGTNVNLRIDYGATS